MKDALTGFLITFNLFGLIYVLYKTCQILNSAVPVYVFFFFVITWIIITYFIGRIK